MKTLASEYIFKTQYQHLINACTLRTLISAPVISNPDILDVTFGYS